jgi:hypothetical protein
MLNNKYQTARRHILKGTTSASLRSVYKTVGREPRLEGAEVYERNLLISPGTVTELELL